MHTHVHAHTSCFGHAATTMRAHTSHFGECYLLEKYWNSMRLSAEQYGFGEERKENVLSIQWPQLVVPFFQNMGFVDCYD